MRRPSCTGSITSIEHQSGIHRATTAACFGQPGVLVCQSFSGSISGQSDFWQASLLNPSNFPVTSQQLFQKTDTKSSYHRHPYTDTLMTALSPKKYWRESWAVGRRILTELFRRKRSLISWLIFPALILMLNGLITAERADTTVSTAFEVAAPPTLVGAALFFSCLGGGVATVVSEREQQTLKRLFLSPLSGVSYFLGIFLAHSVIGVGQTLVIFAIAAFAGANFSDAAWPLAILIIWLSILAYVGLGFMLGTQFARRTEDVSALIAAFGVPLMVLGGAFLPISLFPESLLDIARFNPIYHMTEALTNALLNADNPLGDSGGHFWFLLTFAFAMVLVGWLSYKRMLVQERQL